MILRVAQESPDWESLGVAGALLSRYQRDQQALLEQLGIFLEGTLPQATSVRRTLGVIGKRRVTGISVDIGSSRYGLSAGARGALEATRTRVVRDVAVRTESLSVEAWLQEVATALEAELQRSGQGRAALTRLLQGDT